MRSKTIRIIFLSIVLILCDLPIYAAGYEDVSLFKIISKLLFYLFVIAFVIFLTLYGTKMIGKGLKGISRSKYINFLDMVNLPGGSKLVITKIGEKIYILSTNNTNTNVIDIIDKDDFTVETESFDNYLNKYLEKDNYQNIISNLFDKLNNKKDKEDNNNEKEKY